MREFPDLAAGFDHDHDLRCGNSPISRRASITTTICNAGILSFPDGPSTCASDAVIGFAVFRMVLQLAQAMRPSDSQFSEWSFNLRKRCGHRILSFPNGPSTCASDAVIGFSVFRMVRQLAQAMRSSDSQFSEWSFNLR